MAELNYNFKCDSLLKLQQKQTEYLGAIYRVVNPIRRPKNRFMHLLWVIKKSMVIREIKAFAELLEIDAEFFGLLATFLLMFVGMGIAFLI